MCPRKSAVIGPRLPTQHFDYRLIKKNRQKIDILQKNVDTKKNVIYFLVL